MSNGSARKSIPADAMEPYAPDERDLVIALLRARRDAGDAIPNREIGAAACRAGVSASTLRRWIRRDPEQLSKAAGLTSELCIQIAMRKGNVAKTFRDLDKSDWPGLLPSERTLQKLVKALPLAEAVSLRHGEARARQHDLVLLRKLTHRNQAWFMDAFYCRRLLYTANGRGVRNAWAFVVVDGASGEIAAITAVREELRPDGTVVKLDGADALHAIGDAMRPWPLLGSVRGRPLVLFHDNATYFNGATFQHALADPLIRVVTETTAPYSPWQNGPSESTVGSLRKLLARPLQDGTYVDLAGNQLVDAPNRVVWLADLKAELVAAAIEFNQLPFRDDRSISKAEAYEQLPGEINPVARELRSRFLRRALVPVETHGATLERETFTHHKLRGRVGRNVEVRYHDMDDSEVEVWWARKYLCTAKNIRDFTDEDREPILFTRNSSRIKRKAILDAAASREEEWADERRAAHQPDAAGAAVATRRSDPFGDDVEDA